MEAVGTLSGLHTLKIRNLNLTDKAVRHLRPLTRLRTLDMHGVRNVSDEALAATVKGMHHLTYLCVAGTRFGWQLLNLLPTLNPNLTTLHLTQNDTAKEKELRVALQRLPALRTLKCRSLYYLTDIALYGCANMRHLTKLDISECKNMEVTVPMIRALPSVEVRTAYAASPASSASLVLTSYMLVCVCDA
jgi:hypothetical protein